MDPPVHHQWALPGIWWRGCFLYLPVQLTSMLWTLASPRPSDPLQPLNHCYAWADPTMGRVWVDAPIPCLEECACCTSKMDATTWRPLSAHTFVSHLDRLVSQPQRTAFHASASWRACGAERMGRECILYPQAHAYSWAWAPVPMEAVGVVHPAALPNMGLGSRPRLGSSSPSPMASAGSNSHRGRETYVWKRKICLGSERFLNLVIKEDPGELRGSLMPWRWALK